MVQNGLERLFDLIKRQKWEQLFTKRDLVFKTECREFYKNLTVSISWKKDVPKSKVNGVEIEFDGMTLATILEIPRNNGLCDYIKEVWEPSRYCDPLEITRNFANDENILEARRKFRGKIKEKEVEIQGESGSDDKFYDVEVEVEEPTDVIVEVPKVPACPASPVDSTTNVQKEKNAAGVNPSGPTGSLPDFDFKKLQAYLDHARTKRLQAELDQARAENARLQALLQQATSQPKP
ncbi:hypothetical protein Dimus_029411 [Dionaea muscipula]